jgi:ectoine hydroxylase-related dioxygenase (phytanoyl-CoA dioxygenase family)
MPQTTDPFRIAEASVCIEDLVEVCSQSVCLHDYAFATDVQSNVLIYSGETLCRSAVMDADAVKKEIARVLKDGPGVLVIKGAYSDMNVIDRCNEVFRQILDDEQYATSSGGSKKGDHFGDNERIWNSFQKICLRDPELFIDYFGNPFIALASEAWLGPGYQISAQMNTVKPGNKSQTPHRDYHLGFQSPEVVGKFPAHTQIMSQFLTLQGGMAHVDMPVELGPTRFLPFSQQYEWGYLACRRPEFVAYIEEHSVQLPLSKGDAVFFNPALFHFAGANRADTDRVANLIQISSPFGRTMETIDTIAMAKAVYPILQGRMQNGTIDHRQLHDTIAAVADGYSFPTNLDNDPPIGGNAPKTSQQIMHEAIAANWTVEQFHTELDAHAARHRA